MFYVKATLAEGVEINIDITGENVFTRCFECDKEMSVDIFEDATYTEICPYSTKYICEECTRKRKGEN